MLSTFMERAILAVLEEPTALCVTALVNTIIRGAKDNVAFEEYQEALSLLFDWQLINFSDKRNPRTLRRIPYSVEESRRFLADLRSSVAWSPSDKLWKWTSSHEMPEVMLTTAGCKAAEQVLSEDGWFGTPG